MCIMSSVCVSWFLLQDSETNHQVSVQTPAFYTWLPLLEIHPMTDKWNSDPTNKY